MTFQNHRTRIDLHENAHSTGGLLTEDLSCLRCHPIRQVKTQKFLYFWRWMTRYLIAVQNYNQSTLNAFNEADTIRLRLQTFRRFTAQTSGILNQYRNIYLTLRFPREPTYFI